MIQQFGKFNIYHDLWKDFDTLHHDILLCKLDNCGIKGTATIYKHTFNVQGWAIVSDEAPSFAADIHFSPNVDRLCDATASC